MTVHAERRVIQHCPQDLYQLVANVRAYPEFLPWCLAARIRHETDHDLQADLIIGFNMFRERFTSHVSLIQMHWKSTSPMLKVRLNIYATNGCFIHIQMGVKLNFTLILNLILGFYSQ